MSDFKPYTEPKMYHVTLSEREVLLIQELRKIKFGSLKSHVAGGLVTRLETISSQLVGDNNKTKITIEVDGMLK